MLAKILRFFIGLLLIPIVIAITVSFIENLTGMEGVKSKSAEIFLWGVLAYVVLHLFLHKPRYVYTVGHEVMHVFATWLSGGKVKSFSASNDGGSVASTKANTFISLSPYFIPTHTLIISALYFIIPFFINIPGINRIYLFLAGFTLALHLVFTAEVLKVRQPDVIRTGYIFSLATIFIINIVIVAFLLSLLLEGASFKSFFNATYAGSKAIYIKVFKQLFMML